ncbi:hypothetical protein C8J56DRAFT_1030645 [Mycena floridula]|nr:hypothetical protein C8J56DRAFT_342384 [Mycena floridula]KAJ7579352.1 hypothetical protein C8J56DRAFT_1030645 [Mycena floridula]
MLLSRLSLAFLVVSFVSAVPVPTGGWASPDRIDDGFKQYYDNFNDFGTPKYPTASPSSRQSTPQSYSSPGPSTRRDKGKAVQSSRTGESSSRQRKSTTPYPSRKPSVDPSSSKRKASTSPSKLSPAQYPAKQLGWNPSWDTTSYDSRSPSPLAQTPARSPSNSLAKLSSKAQGKQVDRSTSSEKKDSKVYCKDPLCLDRFWDKQNMKRHYKSAHGPESEKQSFPCPSCGRNFTRHDVMTRHAETVHRPESEEKPFSCPVCGKKIGRQDNLKRHMSTHGSASKDSKKRT